MNDRQIKLRRWDYVEKTLTEFLSLPGNYIGMVTFFNYPGRHVYQQWTGFFDQNGKEVYEGDYVEWIVNPLWLRYDDEFKEWEAEGKYQQVVVEQVDWKARCFDNSPFGPHDASKCRIIGNIFQNPELKVELQKRRHTNDPDFADYTRKLSNEN